MHSSMAELTKAARVFPVRPILKLSSFSRDIPGLVRSGRSSTGFNTPRSPGCQQLARVKRPYVHVHQMLAAASTRRAIKSLHEVDLSEVVHIEPKPFINQHRIHEAPWDPLRACPRLWSFQRRHDLSRTVPWYNLPKRRLWSIVARNRGQLGPSGGVATHCALERQVTLSPI